MIFSEILLRRYIWKQIEVNFTTSDIFSKSVITFMDKQGLHFMNKMIRHTLPLCLVISESDFNHWFSTSSSGTCIVLIILQFLITTILVSDWVLYVLGKLISEELFNNRHPWKRLLYMLVLEWSYARTGRCNFLWCHIVEDTLRRHLSHINP